NEQIKGGTEISSLLTRLQVSVEDYPELKSNEQFINLQCQIEEMENELQAIRRTYNAAVTDYNNSIEMFPSSIIASWRKHEQQELIEIPESEMRNVNVTELFGK
ncbi:MAG: LemA family protein, partial [Prevotella sp.]|nr:LemA family protein [Prevotella sp.]